MCKNIANAVLEGKAGEEVTPAQEEEKENLKEIEVTETAEPVIFTPDE